MKNTVREMIKDIIEENAVSFKETTSRVLLNKVGNVLSEKYVEISQKLFEDYDDRPSEAEQLQTRVNHLKQRLYEENERPFNNPSFSPGGLNDPIYASPQNPVGMPGTGQGTKPPPNNVPGNIAPWQVFPPPADGTVYWYFGRQYRLNGGVWDVHYPGPDGGTWLPHYWGTPGIG